MLFAGSLFTDELDELSEEFIRDAELSFVGSLAAFEPPLILLLSFVSVLPFEIVAELPFGEETLSFTRVMFDEELS